MKQINCKELFEALGELWLDNDPNLITTIEEWMLKIKEPYSTQYYNPNQSNNFELSSLLPLITKYGLDNEKKIRKMLGDVKVKMSHEIKVNTYSLLSTKINQIIEDLQNRIEKLNNDVDEKERRHLTEEADKLIRSSKSNQEKIVNSILLGEYDHSKKMIILYFDAINKWSDYEKVDFEKLFISIFAHELLHAYHANKTKIIDKKWNAVPLDKRITIESLATYNELLLLKKMGELQYFKKRINDHYSSFAPRLWPYDGIIGILNFLNYLGNDVKRNKFIKQLFDGKLEFHDEELVYYTFY